MMEFATGTALPSGAFARIETDVAGIIDAPIETVWALFTDWSAIHAWMTSPPSPKPVDSSGLVAGQTEEALPRTRLIQFGGEHASEPQLVETLLHADPEAYTLFYRVEGVRPSGYRNYLCYVTLDVVGADRTRLRLNARMDAPAGESAELVRQAIIRLHRDGIIGGFRAFLAGAR